MKKSFTIIELLIVVVIIGVLATIAVPQFATAVERTKFAKAQNNLVLMYKGATMCYEDVYGGNGAWASCDETAAHKYVEFKQSSDSDWSYTYAAGGTIGDAKRLGGKYSSCHIYITDQQKMTTGGSCVVTLT